MHRSRTMPHNGRLGSKWSRSWSIWYICPTCGQFQIASHHRESAIYSTRSCFTVRSKLLGVKSGSTRKKKCHCKGIAPLVLYQEARMHAQCCPFPFLDFDYRALLPSPLFPFPFTVSIPTLRGKPLWQRWGRRRWAFESCYGRGCPLNRCKLQPLITNVNHCKPQPL